MCVNSSLSVVANVSEWLSFYLCWIKLVYLAEGHNDLYMKKSTTVLFKHFLTLVFKEGDVMFVWEIMCLCVRGINLYKCDLGYKETVCSSGRNSVCLSSRRVMGLPSFPEGFNLLWWVWGYRDVYLKREGGSLCVMVLNDVLEKLYIS